MRARWRAHRNDVHERRLPRVLQADECQLHLLLEEETAVRRESRVREVGVRGPCAVAACLRSQLSTGSSHDWNHALALAAEAAISASRWRALLLGSGDSGGEVRTGLESFVASLILFSVTAPHSNTVQSLYCKMNDKGSERSRWGPGRRVTETPCARGQPYLLPAQVLPH